ncbi:MAG: hypothetical protein AAGK05_18070, partial [Pseudomonadota bacterium]
PAIIPKLQNAEQTNIRNKTVRDYDKYGDRVTTDGTLNVKWLNVKATDFFALVHKVNQREPGKSLGKASHLKTLSVLGYNISRKECHQLFTKIEIDHNSDHP